MESEIFKLVLDPKSDLLLQKQVYEQLRQLILSGQLLPGVRLPPSRKLAEQIGVSRKTVVSAYDQLLAEGYVSSQTGSGTFVSDPSNARETARAAGRSSDGSRSAAGSRSNSPSAGSSSHADSTSRSARPGSGDGDSGSARSDYGSAGSDSGSARSDSGSAGSGSGDAVSPSSSRSDAGSQSRPRDAGSHTAAERSGNDAGEARSRMIGTERRANEPTKAVPGPPSKTDSLSLYGRRLAAAEIQSPRLEHIKFPFFNWQPAFDELPLNDWGRIVSKTFRRLESPLLDYAQDPFGHMPLRAALAARLLHTRGLICSPEQIVINCGLAQSLDLIAKLHSEEGVELLVENPSYRPIRDIFRTYGTHIRSIDVDQSGMKTERLAKLSRHNVKLVYVTPSHQFPTGAVLSLARRLELINWATECGAMIIEDDFDSEFRYRGSPIPAMKTLDKENQVLYLSSFTKVFYPSLAIAFMVLPPRLVEVYTKARWLAADQVSIQIQEALAEFMTSGQFDRHVKRMRTVYARRRRALLDAIEDHLQGTATAYGDQAGLSTMIRIKCELEDEEIIERAKARGLALASTRTSYTRNAVRGEFILGYGNMNEQQIRQGIMELRMIVTGK